VKVISEVSLCYGCFEEIGSALVCSNCGYSADSVIDSNLALTPGTVLQGKYLLGKVLGQGGFGITYLAWDLMLNIKLAIKEYMPEQLATRSSGTSHVSVYRSALSGEFEYGLNKFIEEARTLARFNEHPNIISVRDYFEANGTAYLVMNYLEGITLQSYLKSVGGVISPEQANTIFMPVLDALREVHALSVLHRDISPDNLFVTKTGRVILIDFGAARQAMGEKNRSMSVIMKAGFSPEEQYRSNGLQGPWTDIYALAATIYFAVTGKKVPESLDRLVDDTLPAPSELGVETVDPWEKALLKALSVRAADRYQSIDDFQKALIGVYFEKVRGESETETLIPDANASIKESKVDSFDSNVADVPPASESNVALEGTACQQEEPGGRLEKGSAAQPRYVMAIICAAVVIIILAGYIVDNSEKKQMKVISQNESELVEVETAAAASDVIITEDTENIEEAEIIVEPFVNFPDPTNYIASLDAEVINLTFFESGYDTESIDLETVTGNDQFNRNEVRYVNWVMEIIFEPIFSTRNFDITQRFYNPQGVLLYDDSASYEILAGWDNMFASWGYGSEQKGTFAVGEYRVELIVDGVIVAAGSFDIN